jgi:hypothetical protein
MMNSTIGQFRRLVETEMSPYKGSRFAQEPLDQMGSDPMAKMKFPTLYIDEKTLFFKSHQKPRFFLPLAAIYRVGDHVHHEGISKEGGQEAVIP